MKKIKQHFIETTIALSLFAFIFFSSPSEMRAQSPGSASAPTPAPKSETKVTSSDKYTVLAPLPCIESAPTTYIDSAGNTQTNPGIECKDGNGVLQKEVDFKTYVQYTINLLIALSAATAVVMIVWGGIEYMWSASFSDKKMGLARAKNAIYGLLLVLTSYIILRTIDPRLVEIPNTLVPQLTVEEWLTAENSLLRSLEDDAKAYDLKRREIGLEMQQIRKETDSLEKQISDIKQKIENEKKENPGPDNKELASLEKELAKMMEEKKDLGSAYQTKKIHSEFNGILSEILADVRDNETNVTESINNIHRNKPRVENAYETTVNAVKKLGLDRYDEITDQKLNTLAIMDLYIMNMIIIDAKKGTAGYIYSEKFDGSVQTNPEARAVTVVRAELEKEMNRVQNYINQISDSSKTLKEELQKTFDLSKIEFEKKFEK